MHKFIKGTWLEIPAFLVFLLACWHVITMTMSITRYYFGDWAMILALPIYWYYLISPVLDEMWEWFNSKYI